MQNVTITEITGKGDVDFDQAIDTDTVIASGGGVAVNGAVSQSAFNTGINRGILAGDDVNLDESIVGDDNNQINDSHVGAFAGQGDATNVLGENVNFGSGDLLDVDAEGDAQVVNGNGNDVSGDVSVDLDEVDGPINLAIGDDNDQQALEDNSFNADDSFNVDASTEDSFNTLVDDSFNLTEEDNDTTLVDIDESFNRTEEDNDTSEWSWKSNFEQHFDDEGDEAPELDDDFSHFFAH